MRGRADAGVRIAHLVLVLLDVVEKLLEVVRRKVGACDQRHRHIVDEADVVEVGERVEPQLPVQRRRRRHADVMNQDGVTVGLGVLDLLRCQDAARARLVLHDHRLPERLGHRLGDDARHGVGGPAGSIGHEHRERFGGILLRAHARGDER